MAEYPPPTDNVTAIDSADADAVFAHVKSVCDYLYFAPATDGNYPSLSFGSHTAVYSLVYNSITVGPNKLETCGKLYTKLEEYLASVCQQIHDQITEGGASGKELLNRYSEAWKRYDNRSTNVSRIFAYFNRHWIKREEDEGRGAKTLDLVKWGYPATPDLDKDAAEATAKAATDSVVVPIRSLALRKWRQSVAEKLDLAKVVEAVKEVDEAERQGTAGEVRKSLWAVGVDPAKEEMKTLNQLAGVKEEPAAAAAAPEAPAEPATTAEASAAEPAEAK